LGRLKTDRNGERKWAFLDSVNKTHKDVVGEGNLGFGEIGAAGITVG